MSVVLRKVSRRTVRQLLSETNASLTLPKEEQEIASVVDGMLRKYCDSGKNNYIDLQFIEEHKAWELVEYVFNSNKRSIKDVFFIVRYLALFEKFISVIKDNNVELFELLVNIAKSVERDSIKEKSIVCKVGECVEKCCLLIRGTIAVLKVKECKMSLTRSEYVSHLEMLYTLNEYDLLSRTIKANAYINTYWNIPLHLQSKTNINTCSSSLTTHNAVVSSVNDYILQLTPLHSYSNNNNNNNNEQPFEIELFIYEHSHTLSHGDTFNESSLSYNTTTTYSSPYTLISLTQCDIISLPQRIYFKALKHAKMTQRNANISHLLTNTLFLHVNAITFDKHYFNYFKPHTFYLGDYIYNQNDTINNVVIIKDGEVELSLKTSFNFIEELIQVYGGKITYNSFFDNVSDIKRCIACIGNKVTYHKLYVINNKEIFGLDDVVYDNDKALFNAKVVSSECKVFMIDVKVFENVVMKDKFVVVNRMGVVKKRKRLLMEKLMLIRKVLINQYKFLKGERGCKEDNGDVKGEQRKMHFMRKSQSLSPLRFPVVKYAQNNNNNNCGNGNSNNCGDSNGIRFRNKCDEYLPRFTNTSLRSVLCCTHNKSKDEITLEHNNNNNNNNNDNETELINTNNNIMCNTFKTSYTNIFHSNNNNNNNNTHYSPSFNQDPLSYKMRCFKYRKSNTLNTLTPPLNPSSLNNTTFNSKDESTSPPHNFPKSNSCLFKKATRTHYASSTESLKNENLLLTSHISDNNNNINVNTILSEMNVLSKESQRLRVRKNPLNIRNINNKDVMIQHLLMHKIGKDITHKHKQHQQRNSNNIITKTIDFLAMDRFVELVQGNNTTTRRYRPKALNCKIKNGLNCFIKSSHAY